MNEMVDRVRAAMLAELRDTQLGFVDPYNGGPRRQLIRVVIGAMREPTEMMRDAGVDALAYATANGLDPIPIIWRAMITIAHGHD